MISAFVKGQSLRLSQPKIVANSVDYLEMKFVFQTADWTSLAVFAHFKQGQTVYDVLLDDCMITKEKHLNLSEGEWDVYLHGNDTAGKMRITTDVQNLTVQATGFICAPLPQIPLPAAEQTVALATEAKRIAEEANKKAEDALPYAERAEAAASKAELSAKDAEYYAGQSVESAGAALQSELSASGAREEAVRSAKAAKESETTAVGAAGSATASAQSAFESAGTSQGYSESAERSALSASGYETNAHISMLSANESERNAKESEGNAKVSETNAKTSETAAEASKNASKASETSASQSSSKAKKSETLAKSYSDSARSDAETASSAASSLQGAVYDVEMLKKKTEILDARVDSLEMETFQFVEDDSTSVIKNVPVGASSGASIWEIGGKTYKSENLIPFPYHDGSSKGETYTITVKDDGGINIKGFDASIGIWFHIFGNDNDTAKSLVFDQDVYFDDGSNGKQFHFRVVSDDDESSFAEYSPCLIPAGTRIGEIWFNTDPWETNPIDVTFYPMLNYGTSPKPYEPYFAGLRDTKTTAVEVGGANIIPFPYSQIPAGAGSVEISGITWTVNEDGSIVANGTANADSKFQLFNYNTIDFKKLDDITLSGCPAGGSFEKYYIIIGIREPNACVGDPVTIVASTIGNADCHAVVKSGQTANNLVFKPMLNRGSTALKFAKSSKITIPIPAEVQAQEDYGVGIDEYTNPIDLDKGTRTHNAKKIILDGSPDEGWYETAFGKQTKVYRTNIKLADAYYDARTRTYKSSRYPSESAGNIFTGGTAYGLCLNDNGPDTTDVVVVDNTLNFDAFISSLATNPIEIVYRLNDKSITVTDISQYFANSPDENVRNLPDIEVYGGGYVRIVTDTGRAAPSTIGFFVPKQAKPASEGGQV